MLFWMARRVARDTTRPNGGGCLIALIAVIALGGILGGASTQPAPTPVAAAPGWTPGPNGTFTRTTASPPAGTQTAKPGQPAAAPPTNPAKPLTANWGLITLGTLIATIGGLAIIGYRMTPQPITTRRRHIHPCCGTPIEQPHALSCRQNPPGNPAQWSNRR